MTGQVSVQKIYVAWDNFVNGMLYTALMDAEKSLPSEFKKTGSLTMENVEELATLVGDQSGAEVVIIGTRTAFEQTLQAV